MDHPPQLSCEAARAANPTSFRDAVIKDLHLAHNRITDVYESVQCRIEELRAQKSKQCHSSQSVKTNIGQDTIDSNVIAHTITDDEDITPIFLRRSQESMQHPIHHDNRIHLAAGIRSVSQFMYASRVFDKDRSIIFITNQDIILLDISMGFAVQILIRANGYPCHVTISTRSASLSSRIFARRDLPTTSKVGVSCRQEPLGVCRETWKHFTRRRPITATCRFGPPTPLKPSPPSSNMPKSTVLTPPFAICCRAQNWKLRYRQRLLAGLLAGRFLANSLSRHEPAAECAKIDGMDLSPAERQTVRYLVKSTPGDHQRDNETLVDEDSGADLVKKEECVSLSQKDHKYCDAKPESDQKK
uniref:Uncharacterized protein n=1 Tax=Caenorhabditis japonica TaxID=281687 RepID=A0A8R1EUD9_CAEJA